ncbi:glycosyltransferase family 2 protein [Empedobacter falsenii]
MIKLAIVIPYYKYTFFDQCLESLANQTNKNFIVYVGDDSSPEDPTDLISKYSQVINIKYVRFDTNLGAQSLIMQWDRCIDLIEDEEWIMLLGDDDKLSNNAVEDFYNSLSEIVSNDINVVRCNVIEIDGENNVLREFYYPKYELASTSYIKKIEENYHITLPEYIFSKTTYKKFGFKHFPFAFGSDNVAWIEFSEGKEIYTMPNAICYMRLSTINISGNNSNIKEKVFAKYLTHVYIIDNLLNYFDNIQQKIILKKGYKYLLFSNSRNYLERFYYFLKVIKYLTIKDIKLIFFS